MIYALFPRGSVYQYRKFLMNQYGKLKVNLFLNESISLLRLVVTTRITPKPYLTRRIFTLSKLNIQEFNMYFV